MIHKYEIKNMGPVSQASLSHAGKINLIIGRNGSGKTFQLKTLYSTVKAAEQFQRGKEMRTYAELLHDKLYWTFQPQKIGDLVSKGAIRTQMTADLGTKRGRVEYAFGPTTSRTIPNVRPDIVPTTANSIFLPAKEIISLQSIIKETRSDKYNDFGFDDTYFDVANALNPTRKGRNYDAFATARKSLNEAIKGRLIYDAERKEWQFKDNERRIYNIELTAEGIKKLSILDALLGNHYLSKDSIVFIDEPEAALHPALISRFMEIIYELTKTGMQFFIASHSYFVIKKLYILAHKYKTSIPVLSYEEDRHWTQHDLLKGMPDNSIINESIRLYEEEIDL